LRPAWLEIDLDAISHNLASIKTLTGPGTDVIAIVKCNAYGHGAVEVSRQALASGARMLAVALVEEGIQLREAGIATPVLVLGATDADQAPLYAEYDLTASVFRLAFAEGLSTAAQRAGRPVHCHVKVDTGMGRQGVLLEDVGALTAQVAALPGLRLSGIFSHFASAYHDPEFTAHQVGCFNEAVGAADAAAGCRIPLRHLASTGGILHHRDAWADAVRPGALLYGICSGNGMPAVPDARQAMSLKARIVAVKDLCAGGSVGYDRTFVSEGCTRTAILPLGYGDGYPRALSNNAEVLVGGRRCPVVGRISMDAVVIDVGLNSGVQVGDEAVLMGRQGGEFIAAGELARRADTVVQEIVARMSSRLPRVFVGGRPAGEGTL
jgi:alanine racemase